MNLGCVTEYRPATSLVAELHRKLDILGVSSATGKGCARSGPLQNQERISATRKPERPGNLLHRVFGITLPSVVDHQDRNRSLDGELLELGQRGIVLGICARPNIGGRPKPGPNLHHHPPPGWLLLAPPSAF